MHAVARRDLGMTDAEFLASWPAQFWSLWAREAEREQRADYRAGVIAALIFNANRGGENPPPPAAPWDFMPSLAGLKPRERRQSAGEQIAILDGIIAQQQLRKVR